MHQSRVAAAALKNPAPQLVIISTLSLLAAFIALGMAWLFAPPAQAASGASFYYTFNSPGALNETLLLSQSSSPYFWLRDGGLLSIVNGIGSEHGAGRFLLLERSLVKDSTTDVLVNRVAEVFSSASDAHPYNGEAVYARYADDNNFYYAGLRADGTAIIKKKKNGAYATLAQAPLFAGTYGASHPDLIPHNTWINLRLSVTTLASGAAKLVFYADVGNTGTWKQILSATDSVPLGAGLSGVESDHADIRIDNFKFADAGIAASLTAAASTLVAAAAPAPAASYDSAVLSAKPALFLTMGNASKGVEQDKSGHGLSGTYKGGTPASATLPNGEQAADFNGSSQYLTVPSNSSLSISTQKQLTWEAWIRPDTLQFANASEDGYVDWMGKCQDYSPTCEWEARMYGASTAEGRPDRLSAYVFNPSAGLGSAADWQPATGVISQGQWVHVVAEYDTTTTPAGCSSSHPGSINIWVNGVKQNFAAHAPTGCMSQYSVSPKAGNSPLNIGTMALDTWFKGAVGKVAVYNRLLSQSEINSHYTAMTGKTPTGSCGQTCTF